MPTLYSHRNGETEPPSEQGDYGFRGRMDVGERWESQEQGIVHVDDNGLIDLPASKQRYPDHCARLEQCEGQWWGPITGPWGK